MPDGCVCLRTLSLTVYLWFLSTEILQMMLQRRKVSHAKIYLENRNEKTTYH